MSFLSLERIYAYLFFFLSVCFILLLSFFTDSTKDMGFLLVVVSFVTLSRFLSLVLAKTKRTDQLLSDKILTSLEKDAIKNKKNILKRVASVDYAFWNIALLLCIAWVCFCTISPNEITAIKTLHFEFSQFFNEYYNDKDFSDHAFIAKVFPYVAVALIFLQLCFLQLSLSAGRSFIRLNLIVFLPAFISGVVILNFTVGRVFLFQWPDAHFLVGGGAGVSKVLFLLHPNMALDSASFFMARFLDLGFVGAYGFYLLFMPALSVFFHIITIRRRRKTLAWVGIGVIGLMLMVDMFWLYSTYGKAVLLMGWLVVMSCWGQSGFKTPHLQR